MGSSFTGVLVVAGAIVAVLALVLLGGGAFTRTTSTFEVAGRPATPVATPPADSSYAIVVSSHQTASPAHVDLFGLKIGSSRYAAHVMFVAPEGCTAVGAQRIEATGPCAGIPVAGDVTGGGMNEEGHDFIIVSVKVSEACAERLTTGDRWPQTDPACSEP